MKNAILKSIIWKYAGLFLLLCIMALADDIAHDYGYKNSGFMRSMVFVMFGGHIETEYKYKKLQKEMTGAFTPAYLSQLI